MEECSRLIRDNSEEGAINPGEAFEVSDDAEKKQGRRRLAFLVCFGTLAIAVVMGVLFLSKKPAVKEAGVRKMAPQGLFEKRVLNSAFGASMWEETPFSSTDGTNPRYAVVYVWSDPQVFFQKQHWEVKKDTFVGPYSKGRGSCALALSALASRHLLQEAVGPTAVADAVVITDNIADEQASYFNSLGIRVVKTNLTDYYTFEKYNLKTAYHGNPKSAYFKLRASVIKASVAGLTEYKSIIYLDLDAYLVAVPQNPDAWWGSKGSREHGHNHKHKHNHSHKHNRSGDDNHSSNHSHSGKHHHHHSPDYIEFLSFKCCNDAPLEVGVFALRPNQSAYEDMMRLVKIGFSPAEGWGLQGLRIGADSWHFIECEKNHKFSESHHEFTRSYCADPNTSKWEFVGAEGDKGLLFTEYSVIRRSMEQPGMDDFRETIPSFNFYGPYKPWMPDTPCLDDPNIVPWAKKSLTHLAEYWSLYRNYSRPIMSTVDTKSSFNSFCIAELDKGMTSVTKRCPSYAGVEQ